MELVWVSLGAILGWVAAVRTHDKPPPQDKLIAELKQEIKELRAWKADHIC